MRWTNSGKTNHGPVVDKDLRGMILEARNLKRDLRYRISGMREARVGSRVAEPLVARSRSAPIVLIARVERWKAHCIGIGCSSLVKGPRLAEGDDSRTHAEIVPIDGSERGDAGSE